jgi:transcriptional regulator with XRE-family HTH domain
MGGQEDSKMFDLGYEQYENTPEFQAELSLLDITEQICELMEKKNISRTELARRLDKSRAYVSKILNGPTNITISTLTKIAVALDEKISVNFSNATSFESIAMKYDYRNWTEKSELKSLITCCKPVTLSQQYLDYSKENNFLKEGSENGIPLAA